MIPYRNYNLQGLDFFKFCHVIFISLGLSAFDIDENNQCECWMLFSLFLMPMVTSMYITAFHCVFTMIYKVTVHD